MFDLSAPAAYTRRALLLVAGGLAAAGLVAWVYSGEAHAQQKKGPAEVNTEELHKPGEFPDMILGNADSKVTVVEYASLTCPHCANFATKVFPEFKTKYIDSGKIKYVFRGFALNPLDQAAQMLVQCLGGDKRINMVEAFYAKQADWAFTNGNPVPKLFDIAKQAGFTQESFDKCLKDQALLDKLEADRKKVSESFGINSTPTFFVNGKRLQEVPTLANLDKLIEPALQ